MQWIEHRPGGVKVTKRRSGTFLSVRIETATHVAESSMPIYTQDEFMRGRARGLDLLGVRVKPHVRVKAPCVPSLDLLIKRAVAAFDAMTPEQKDAHVKAQRASWVRGEMALSRMGLG